MVREVDGGSSHASQNTSIVHFGLGENTKIDSISITWPGGKLQSLVDIAANQLVEIDELEEIKISDKLSVLQKVGLGYIKLGQSSSTLSGGEAQRVKLAYFLSVKT